MNSRPGRLGRPPGPHDDTLAKLLPIALDLFLREGGTALTPTRLHAESGVARATIYRNWPEPADLIEIMLARATDPPPDNLLTGDTRADLHQAAGILRKRFDDNVVRPLFAVCMEYGRISTRMTTTAQAFVDGILEPVRMVVASAVEDGALQGHVADLVSEVAGPLLFEHLVLGQQVSKKRADAVINHFLDHHLS